MMTDLSEKDVEKEKVYETGDNFSEHICYILTNDSDDRTYNGYTNNPKRRLRQHNGEIKGGARYTSRPLRPSSSSSSKEFGEDRRRHWKFLALIESPQFSHTSALSFEWHLKYPTNKRPRPKHFDGANGRLEGLVLALRHRKFDEFKFRVSVDEAYTDMFRHMIRRITLTNDQESSSSSSLSGRVYVQPMCQTPEPVRSRVFEDNDISAAQGVASLE
jgi:hypothetical protein